MEHSVPGKEDLAFDGGDVIENPPCMASKSEPHSTPRIGMSDRSSKSYEKRVRGKVLTAWRRPGM